MSHRPVNDICDLARRLALPIVALALLGGCDVLNTSPAVYTEIEVRVIDEAGDPVMGAGVEAVRGFTRYAVGHTDSDGRVRLTYLPVLSGVQYLIRAHAPAGYSSEGAERERTITVTGEPVDLTLHLFTIQAAEPPVPEVAQRVRNRRGR